MVNPPLPDVLGDVHPFAAEPQAEWLRGWPGPGMATKRLPWFGGKHQSLGERHSWKFIIDLRTRKLENHK